MPSSYATMPNEAMLFLHADDGSADDSYADADDP